MKLFGKNIKNLKIGVIGGQGKMAKLFIPMFKKLGMKVLVSDVKTKLSNKNLVQKCDIILISVPIRKTVQIIKDIVKYTKDDQILLDFTSLKKAPVEAMLEGKAEVVGMHPMFGPSIHRLDNQRMVMCPVRTNNKKFIQNLFEQFGVQIFCTTPEKHDKIMGVVQVLIHFHTILLGNTLRTLNIDLKEIENFMSPIYKLEFSMIARLFSQDPEIYGPILMLNPATKSLLNDLSANSDKLKQIINKKDLERFKKEFSKTSLFLGKFSEKASKQSEKIIDSL